MIAAGRYEPSYVALIDSRTLQTEGLFLPMHGADLSEDDFSSVYALLNRFSTVNRRRFILALNTRSCFNCTVTGSSAEYSVELYSTNRFGAAWSHILILRTPRDTFCSNPHILESSASGHFIIEALSSIRSYNQLAANNPLAETPAVTRQQLDNAVTLCSSLINLICEYLI